MFVFVQTMAPVKDHPFFILKANRMYEKVHGC